MCANPASSLRPSHGHRQPRRQQSGGSSIAESAEYALMRQYRKRANEYLSRALEIDESGRGDKAAAIDFYSKAVTELENGVSCPVNVEGEEAVAVENLRKKMMTNLDNARDRVNFLLGGGDLQWHSGSTHQPHPPQPMESLRFPSAAVGDKRPAHHPPHRPPPHVSHHPTPSTFHHPPSGKRAPVSGGQSDSKHESSNLKGVDKKLASTILDELVESDSSVTTWDDIVGLDLPKRTLQEIVILPALRPELFTGLRSPCRGLLLFGPPGNGKTMLAKAVAHESQAKFFNISASSLTSKWVGDGERLVRALFALARELQPSIIFLDEVDALLSRRGESEHDSMRRLKNEFLQSFDGMHTTEGERILVMAATNRPQELDDAALRRFGKRIYIPLPGHQARKAVLAKLLSKHHHSINNTQLEKLAEMTDGYSASDLKALASDASLGPIRELDLATLKSVPADKVRPINLHDFEESLRQSRSSVSTDLIKGLEEWNAKYGVSA